MRQFGCVVVGDVTNASGDEQMLREKDISRYLEDPVGIALYAKYRAEKPELDIEYWEGSAAIRKARRFT